MITYAKNRHLHDVVRKIPLSRILLETDSPYFLPRQEPISLTGGMSHPGFVIHTAAQIAHLKEVPIRGEPFYKKNRGDINIMTNNENIIL